MGRKREGARRFRPLELLRLEEAEKRERERRGCQLEISTYFPFLPHHFFSFFLSVFSYRLGKMARPLHTKGTRGKCLPSVLALLTLLASVSVHIAEGISFDMMFQTKCLFQDIENGQASTVEWRAVSIKSIKQHQEEDNVFSIEDADDIPVNVVITSPVPRSAPLYQGQNEPEGKFNINADHGDAEEDYKICFTVRDAATAKDTKLVVNWRVGALAQDWEVLAKKEHIDHISVELQKYEDLVKEMRQEMLHMKKVDKIALKTREAAHKRVEFFSLMTMVVCIAFTVGQYFFLKRFFKSKKLL